MHEFSMLQAMCRQLEELAYLHRATGIVRIVLQIGPSTHLTPEHLLESFQVFRESNPLLCKTVVEIRPVPTLPPEEIILRDVELEVPEAQDE